MDVQALYIDASASANARPAGVYVDPFKDNALVLASSMSGAAHSTEPYRAAVCSSGQILGPSGIYVGAGIPGSPGHRTTQRTPWIFLRTAS